jgi:hypothetical protein
VKMDISCWYRYSAEGMGLWVVYTALVQKCPPQSTAIHRSEPREGGAPNRACITGRLRFDGGGSDNGWYMLEEHLYDVGCDVAWGHFSRMGVVHIVCMVARRRKP